MDPHLRDEHRCRHDRETSSPDIQFSLEERIDIRLAEQARIVPAANA
jgi:hypothetical protein